MSNGPPDAGVDRISAKDSKLRHIPAGRVAPDMVRSPQQLGMCNELAAVPLHVGGELWTLHEAANHLYHVRRDPEADPQRAAMLAAELARLRGDAEDVGDTELAGAADALEDSARSVLEQTDGASR